MRKEILSFTESNLVLKRQDIECECGDEITLKEKCVLGFSYMFFIDHHDLPSSFSHPIADEGPNTDDLPFDPDKVGIKTTRVEDNLELVHMAFI